MFKWKASRRHYSYDYSPVRGSSIVETDIDSFLWFTEQKLGWFARNGQI
jgi:hypothetical protein